MDKTLIFYTNTKSTYTIFDYTLRYLFKKICLFRFCQEYLRSVSSLSLHPPCIFLEELFSYGVDGSLVNDVEKLTKIRVRELLRPTSI